MKNLNFFQRLLKKVVSRDLFESLEAGTRMHTLECQCGYKDDLWEAGGLMVAGSQKKTLCYCEGCRQNKWRLKRRKTFEERLEESKENKVFPVFLSSHTVLSTIVAWLLAAVIWSTPLFIPNVHTFAKQKPFLYFAIIIGTFIIGWIFPYLWITTRYRITKSALKIYKGSLKKILKLGRIKSVTEKDRGIQINYLGKSKRIMIYPKEQKLFLLELKKVCSHLD